MKKFLNWLKSLSKTPVERVAEDTPVIESVAPADIPAYREEFNTIYRDLFEDRTLREIYTGEKISVYAVAEKHYAVVSFTDRFPEDNFMFLNINEVEAKHVVEDEEFFLKILAHKKSIGRVAFLNAKSKLFLQKVNAERLAAGTWNITPEIDAEVLGKKAPASKETWRQLHTEDDKVHFRFISNAVRFGWCYKIKLGRKKYFAVWGEPVRNDDYFDTAEITEEEFMQINREYPSNIDVGREQAMLFREKYIDGHKVILEGLNQLLK